MKWSVAVKDHRGSNPAVGAQPTVRQFYEFSADEFLAVYRSLIHTNL